MYDIPTDNISRDFALCWQAAGLHLQTMGDKAVNQIKSELLMLPQGWGGGACVWQKIELRPPFLEHLSFRLGNHLFFVRIEDMEDKLDIPGNRGVLQRIADACNGHACLMPMLKRGEKWTPASSDWGLTRLPSSKIDPPHPDAYGFPLDPLELISSEKIEMSDWELQDFAVQVVRNSLPHEKLMSWNTDPEVSPSLWFVGDQGPEWVVVKSLRYPAKDAELPRDIDRIAKSCSRMSNRGNFAVVSAAAADDPFDGGKPHPLYRGHNMVVSYQGMKKIKAQG